MTKKQAALELRKALQIFLSTLDAETDKDAILSVPSVYPKWESGKTYKADTILAYGENSVGDVQLYTVLQDHTSQDDWTPDAAVSLYKIYGLDAQGHPEWVQPLGAADAYNSGDVVSYGGRLYKSTVDANVWAPGVYGWEETE